MIALWDVLNIFRGGYPEISWMLIGMLKLSFVFPTQALQFSDNLYTINPVDNFWTVVDENPTPYGILALWAINGLSIVYWEMNLW